MLDYLFAIIKREIRCCQPGKPDIYSFNEGAAIRLEKSDTSRIEKIVIQVHSLDAAKKYLQLHALLGEVSENSIYLNSQAVNGLSIEFVSE